MRGNKIGLVIIIFIIISPALAFGSTNNTQQKDEAQRLFEEWKKAFDEERFSESIPIIEKAIELDPSYREKARAYIREMRKRVTFARVELDPLLKRKIKEQKQLRRMKAVKEAFDVVIRENFTFDTNPFRKSQNVKYDYILDSNPSISLKLGDPEQGLDLLNLSYSLHYYTYFRHRNQDRFDHLFNFDFKIPNILSLNAHGKKFSLNVRDYFHPGTFYATSEERKFLNQVYNEFETEVGYTLSPKTSLGMDYEHVLQYYKRDSHKQFNYQKNILRPAFYYHITPKTSIYGGYTFGIVDYYAGGTYESNFNIVRAGIVGQLTPKSSIRFDTGYELRNYHMEPEGKDTDRYIFELSYANQLSRKTNIRFYAHRSIEESTFTPNPYFVTTLGKINSSHLITPKLTLSLGGMLMHNQYPLETVVTQGPDKFKRRADWHYSLNSDILYRITSWLESGLNYEFTNRLSNVDTEQYLIHIFSTNITARY